MADGNLPARRKAPNILVVEDNPSIAECLRSVLAAVGYDVLVAANGRQGMDQICKIQPALVLLDLNLPDMHGGSLLKAVRADAAVKHIPVIVLTSSEKISDALNAVAFGANSYMTKPFDPANLVVNVAQFVKSPAGA